MVTGHLEQQAAFTRAHDARTLHHAWLLAGPPGLGKRTWANAAALGVLAGTGRFDTGRDHPAARLAAAGAHPDLKTLEREEKDKGGLSAFITVDQIRQLTELFTSTSSQGGWRVVIVDAMEDLNLAAANALLKLLEEPPAKCLFLCVSQAPERLLPTLRSRCRLVRFKPLAGADVEAVLAAAGVPEAERATLAAIADGAPGRALRHAGLGVGEMVNALQSARGAGLARSLALKAAQPRFEALAEIAPALLATRARDGSVGAAERWPALVELLRQAGPRALDPQTVTLAAARAIAEP